MYFKKFQKLQTKILKLTHQTDPKYLLLTILPKKKNY